MGSVGGVEFLIHVSIFLFPSLVFLGTPRSKKYKNWIVYTPKETDIEESSTRVNEIDDGGGDWIFFAEAIVNNTRIEQSSMIP